MTHFLCFFICGVFIFFMLPTYLSPLLLLALALPHYRKTVFFICLGYVWTFLFGNCLVLTELPSALDNQKLLISGRVLTEPACDHYKCQFIFDGQIVNGENSNYQFKLSDYRKQHLWRVGQQVNALVKLKKFRNYNNPGSPFFHEKQQANGLAAYGYIIRVISVDNGSVTLLQKLRRYLNNQINELYKQAPQARALIKSIILGDRRELASSDWQRFQLTGTIHLMAISGLHVGLVAGFGFVVSSFIWRFFPTLCYYLPASQFAAIMAWTVAFSYSCLAGFSVATQRAFMMSSIFLVGIIARKKTYSIYSLLLALWLVLVINPYSIYLIGLYLSFFVTFILLWFYKRSRLFFIFIQFRIWILLLPISIYVFNYYSLVTIPANLIGIPLFGFAVLPLGFISLIAIKLNMSLAKIVAKLDSLLIDIFYAYLDYLASFKTFVIQLDIANVFLALTCTLLCFLALNANRLKGYLLSLTLIVMTLIPSPSVLEEGELLVNILDVGHGMAIVIRTMGYVIVYDTAIKSPSGFDLGEQVVRSFLKSEGVKVIDALVISHEDMDHRGGEMAIRNNFRIKKTFRNKKQNGFLNCHQQASWDWNGITFKFLKVKHRENEIENNLSCVLMIDNGTSKLLLAGDIQKRAEEKYIKRYGNNLRADVLVIPHHGSKTSSSLSFLKKVKPKFAFLSEGKNNRYRLPNKTVITRYRHLKIRIFNTAKCGMISWKMVKGAKIKDPQCYTRVYGLSQ